MSRNTYRIVVAFVLACLMTVTANALPLSLDSRQPAGFAAVWKWIASRLSSVTAVWQEEGSQMDPNGATGEEGSGMDPNGMTGDEGSQMDPNG